jgi:hypothetical protein
MSREIKAIRIMQIRRGKRGRRELYILAFPVPIKVPEKGRLDVEFIVKKC